MTRTALNHRSRPSCSVIALATVLAVGATPAAAQSFNGEGVFAVNGGGSANIATGAGTTTITLNTGQSVINWTPTDNATNTTSAIQFQNANTTATFTAGGDFAVLNNIDSASVNRAIAMNGTVNARIGGVEGVQGGSVYFYAPGGFLFGSGSSFNVGALVVSALPIEYSANGFIANWGTANTVNFQQAENPEATIVSQGTIDANVTPFGVGAVGSSYVAMVAPRVQHTGSIDVNGSAALVAAEEATISFSPDGLFNISVSVGTDHSVTDGINVTGDIGGEAPSEAGDHQRVYLVAVPKNDALTMVISQGADLGFEPASEASIDEYGAVVLSAGHNIFGGEISSEASGSGATANFWFTGAHALNNLFGEATGHAHLYSTSQQASQLVTTFDHDVTVHAAEEVSMSASGEGASLTVGGNLSLSTDDFANFGGDSAMGGHTALYAQDGGNLTVTGDTLLTANGYGGNTESPGADGGDGTGGFVEILALSGGDLQLGGSLDAQANGIGGASYSSGNGGTGRGGNNGVETQGGVSLRVSDATMGIAGDAWLWATGEGGRGSGAGNTGGSGIGGYARIQIDGADAELTINGAVELDASGFGYDYKYDFESDVDGGDGTGGIAEISSSGGLIDLLQAVDLFADGTGGNANGTGNGGDGLGGRSRVLANDGTIHIHGSLELDATARGGDGATGGSATGIVTPENDEGAPPAAMLWAGGSTAELRVDGLTDIDVSAIGGSAFDGNGGNAQGGEIDIVAQHGDILLYGDVIGNADAFGGDGGIGGDGGDAFGGAIDVNWALNQETGLSGTIALAVPDPENVESTFGTVTLSANGTGGDGGEGAFSPEGAGGTGGAGGDGNGGGISYVGSAGGGTLTVGSTTLAANGIGGDGGTGGSGATGGNGGDGGIGTGGFIQTGTISNEGSTTSGGTATFTFLSASSNASGGAGGDGGEGFESLGLGGDGGDAFGGRATFLVRGIAASADSVSLFANATGGDGGFGSADGNGGDASSGFVAVESMDRYGHPTQRGSLTADDISATAIAQGGSGAVDGTSTVIGGSYFQVLNGDADIGTLSMTIAGDNYVDGLTGSDFILAQDGAATIGSFTYDTTGELAVFTTSTGSITAVDMSLSAGNFVDRPVEGPLPAPGTLFATNLSVSSDGDFIAHANLDVVNDISISVPGSIRFNNALSDSFVDLDAQGGSIDIGNVDASSSVSLVAGTSIDGGNVDAGGSVFAQSGEGDISLGSVTSAFSSIFIDAAGDAALAGDALADGDIEINATGDIDIQDATAGESVDLFADGSVAALNLTAGDSVLVEAGGSVDVDDISAGLVDQSTNEGAEHMVRIVSGTGIETGNIDAFSHIGLATPGTIDTLDIEAGGIFMALAHGDMNIGDAIAEEVFLSDYAVLNFSGITATCIGNCGTLGADGVVTAPPSGPSYSYVTTDDGQSGAGQIPGAGGTNGSLYTTEFDAAAGEALDFWFNYVTSDGSTFNDYAWAGLYDANLNQVAVLFTARTQPDGTIVPGQGLPGVEAALDPSSVPIIPGGPEWSPLGANSGACFDTGCGFTDWVNSTYEIAEAGSYVLRFGVTNWSDTDYQSGLAFSGLSIGATTLAPTLLTNTGGSITIGDVQTGKFSAAAGTTLTTGIIDSSGSITLDAGGAILTENLNAENFVLATGGSITTQNIDAGAVDMTSTAGNITVNGDIFASDGVALDAFANIQTDNIEAGSVDMVSRTGNITVSGDILAFDGVTMDAFGNILTGDITAGSIDLLAGGDITTDDLTTQFLQVLAQDGPITALLFPGASITLESGGDIDTGNIDSIDGVYANAGGSITTLDIEANDFVQLLAVDDITTDDITAFSQINVESSNGGITTQDLVSTDGDIDLDAFGNISFASADADTEFDFSAGGNVEGGNSVAGNQISGDAGGTIELGDLTVEGALLEGEPFSIGIVAGDDMSVGNVTGAHGVGLATLGDLSTGNINAGDLFMALVGGSTTIDGSITTTGEDGGQVYIANASMCEAGGECDPDGEGDFIPAAVLALDPLATGGSITINGPVTTGAFRAAAGDDFIANAITAPGISNEATSLNGIQVWAGGTAAVNGLWSADGVRITSNDINITGTGVIDGFYAELVSTNAQQTVVGDGVGLPGYNLSDAEYDRIDASLIHVAADASQGANPLMFIGDLSVQHAGEGGEYSFSTGEGDIETGSGRIRVVGDALFSNMELSDVYFTTGTFQLDAATATLALTGTGSELAGELGIEASNIHVASGAILDQLAADPQYDGYQQDLNLPADVQRPEGVVRAANITLDFEGAETATLYVQNTGTSETPAGFLVSEEIFVGEDDELTMPPGSIDLIINGQIQGEGGTLTGIDVRDAMVEAQGGDITPFTSNSTINGCPLTGACVILPPPPPPSEGNVVDNFIDLLFDNPLGDSDFGNEQDIDDNSEGDEGANNPISPPQPLFDTRPLIPSGDVNDPVSGTGNPALLGSDQQCEEDEQGQCPANPVKGDTQ